MYDHDQWESYLIVIMMLSKTVSTFDMDAWCSQNSVQCTLYSVHSICCMHKERRKNGILFSFKPLHSFVPSQQFAWQYSLFNVWNQFECNVIVYMYKYNKHVLYLKQSHILNKAACVPSIDLFHFVFVFRFFSPLRRRISVFPVVFILFVIITASKWYICRVNRVYKCILITDNNQWNDEWHKLFSRR